jgi:large subunit ribosomal protein L4
MALLSKFQDRQALILDGLALKQPRTKEVARALGAIRRPDLSEREATESVGESKAQARKRTLERRSVLIGLPAHDPIFHRSARNIDGVKVAPVAEFNTYDILRQRYLVLTREALATLKEQVKAQVKPKPASDHPVAGPAEPTTTGEGAPPAPPES